VGVDVGVAGDAKRNCTTPTPPAYAKAPAGDPPHKGEGESTS